ncbi:MAG: hypothetical protein LQ346_007393 [Caloplaca aetnensis]|nr:MAG: hypothetical protein LQ346_007393 [Caloplaca aetnensis]
MAGLRTAKRELRRLVRQKLPQVDEQSIHRQCSCNAIPPPISLLTNTESWPALAAQETLLSLPEYHSAKRLSVYLSMPKGELATGRVVNDALRRGKEVYVPYIHRAAATSATPASWMDMVSLHSQKDFDQLEVNSWGIPTPGEPSISGRKGCLGGTGVDSSNIKDQSGGVHALDIVVMPGLAFDRRLARLGHGKGYYDFFLARYQRTLGKNTGSESKMPLLGMRDLVRQLPIRPR